MEEALRHLSPVSTTRSDTDATTLRHTAVSSSSVSTTRPDTDGSISFEIPKFVPPDGRLASSPKRVPEYQPLQKVGVTAGATVVEVPLPGKSELLQLWTDLEPLELGTDNFPPALDDTALGERVITWLRVKFPATVSYRVLWAGINAALVTQRVRVTDEVLPRGTGEPDQAATLSRVPVIPESVTLTVTASGKSEPWMLIDDLLGAGPEVPVPDLREPPGIPPIQTASAEVFALDAEAGEIKFGDGLHGARPRLGAVIRATYDYSEGKEGNIGPDAIKSGPGLPPGFTVTNPVRAWGGADAETVEQAEKLIPRYLQHRDRLVSAEDFDTITRRTPGIEIGRVEVIPAYNPTLKNVQPGDGAGAVTLMVIPKNDAAHPEAPYPDRFFIDTVCSYLDKRRLVTTEVFLRGPDYKSIWVSIGIDVVTGASTAEVREAVVQRVKKFLSPLPADIAENERGWPLQRAVVDLEILVVASRVPNVLSVRGVLLANAATSLNRIPILGLELPCIERISVTVGDPASIEELKGMSQAEPDGEGSVISVPLISEECR
jgi:hypothetical protein